MDAAAVLLDFLDRLPGLGREAVEGLDPAALRAAPPGANPIGWLVWHGARVVDRHLAEAFDAAEVWTRDQWAPRFGLPPEAEDTGYGHSAEQVAALRPDGAQAVTGYLDAVAALARTHCSGLSAADFDRVLDASWDPPVVLGVRLVSAIGDCVAHLGQAQYLRGINDRRSGPPTAG